jgi:hypothetical protein
MKKIVIFLLLVLVNCNLMWSQCLPTVNITGVYISTYTGSNSWIASNGITTIPSGANVTLDGNPATNGYVLLNAGFETQANSTFTAVVQTPCNPLQTQIQSSQCGSVLNGLATTINASPVSGAQEYRFKITQIDKISYLPIAAPIIKDRPVNNLALSNVIGIIYDAKYQIQIDVKLGNVWQNNFGPACYVSTPSPVCTIGTQCNSTLTAMSQFVYCNSVSNVLGYRFRVTNTLTNAVQVLDQGLNRFSFNQLTDRAFNTTYTVEVALKNTDGTFLPYSSGCPITTPAFPTSEVRLSQCDYTALSNTESFVVTAVSGATEYRIMMYNTLGYSFSIDRALNTFNLNMFPGLIAGSTYSVQVAVRIAGVFGPFGKICNLTTPGGGTRMMTDVKVSNEFLAIAYPNPFDKGFTLDVKTSAESAIQIRVYDMLGKLVENETIAISELESLQIGANYTSGVYNVIVSQEGNTQTLRVIKR